MTIAHLSDTHIGFRQFARTNEQGFNMREADVMKSFRACLDAIAEREPDLVVHSGDFFDRVRPSNYSIVLAYRALASFQRERQNRPLIIVAGNHETPRTHDAGNILELFRDIPGVYVFASERENQLRLDIPDLDLEVVGVPSAVIERQPLTLEPNTSRRHRVLVLHGMERQVLPENADFDIERAHVDKWSYVAMGDYHSFQAYGNNCCYSGSTDYTSTDIWSEIAHEKVWVWFDTEAGKMDPVPCEHRKAIDLPPIDGRDLTGAQITEAALAAAIWDEAELPIVRQKVLGVRPESKAEIDYRTIHDLRKRCLEYKLDTVTAFATTATARGERVGVTLEDEWRAHVRAADLRPDLNRERVLSIGEERLAEAIDETNLAEA